MEEKKLGFFKGFFSDSKGNPSSKRLCFILSNIALIGILIFAVFKFKDNPIVIENMFWDFIIYTTIAGGFVTSDVFEKVIGKIYGSKNKNKK